MKRPRVIVFDCRAAIWYTVDMRINQQCAVDEILRRHKDMHPSVYGFLYEIAMREGETTEHISASRFYEKIMDAVYERYGPLSYMVMKFWGVETPQALSKAIYRMVDVGLLIESPGDRREDFMNLPPMQAMLERPLTLAKKKHN